MAIDTRLLNNTEVEDIDVERFGFAYPDQGARVDLDTGSQLRWPSGGLVVARAGSDIASAILPPHVRALADMGALNVKQLSIGPRTADEVRRLIALADLWDRASLPADPFAAIGRLKVERAITSRLASLIGGERWGAIEQRATREPEKIGSTELGPALGTQRYHRELTGELSEVVDRMIASGTPPEGRARLFAEILPIRGGLGGAGANDPRLSEFLLRLASDPASTAPTPEPLMETAIEVALSHPLLLRAARFIVLAIHATQGSDSASIYDGWAWE